MCEEVSGKVEDKERKLGICGWKERDRREAIGSERKEKRGVNAREIS